MTRHDDILSAIEQAISEGRLRSGERLPTVRQLSEELGVSGATVAAAYRTLQRRGLTRGEVGRGTFVTDGPHRLPPNLPGASTAKRDRAQASVPWRRRAVTASARRLQSMFPDALDCTSGKPDPSLFPLEIIKRAWTRAIEETDIADLQYAGPEPVPMLADVLEQRLRRDAIRTGEASLVVGSSAQQLMMLSQSIISMISDVETATIVVEEPGFQTVFDALERHGARLEGVAVDESGVDPGSLDATLSATNAQAVLFTPRAQNPTGSSWSAERRLAIANVLARHPHIIVIEDDQFADLALTSPGSLINDPRLEDRVIYIRSFAKTIAPDLRLAVALAKPRLRNMLAEAKSFYDGWSSRLAQRTLAHILLDPEVNTVLDAARSDYSARRVLAVETLAKRLGPIGAHVRSSDGLNIWISLPPGIDAAEITERAAELGVLVVSGEPFFIRPGNNRTIRMSISQLDLEQTAVSANRLADAALNSSNTRSTVFPI